MFEAAVFTTEAHVGYKGIAFGSWLSFAGRRLSALRIMAALGAPWCAIVVAGITVTRRWPPLGAVDGFVFVI